MLNKNCSHLLHNVECITTLKLFTSHSSYKIVFFFINRQIFPLGNFTKESNHVTLLRLLNEDSSKFDIVNTFKWLLMTSDVGFITTTPSANIPNGEIAIFDFKGFSWWHFMKVAGNITVIKAFLTYVQVRITVLRKFHHLK